jgi:muramidase (phage lysozyme)
MNKQTWQYVVAGLIPTALILLFKIKKKQIIPAGETNLKAFLFMLQYSEGTYGSNAYRTLFGGELFDNYSGHPRIAVTKGNLTSTAAGAYQILYRTWVSIQSTMSLPDFSPQSQDRGAIELIRRRGALDDVMSGRLSLAINKCRKEWASLPNAGYGQREQSLQTLTRIYQQSGGGITA